MPSKAQEASFAMSNELAAASAEQDLPPLSTRIAAGDVSAEKEFVETFLSPIRKMVKARIGMRASDDLISDITQETISTALMTLKSRGIHDSAALAPYLSSVVRTTINKALRNIDRNMPVHDIDSMPDEVSRSPDEVEAERQRYITLMNILDELPSLRDRELLRKYYLAEVPKHEIIKEEGVSPEQFERVISRARLRLRKLLAVHGWSAPNG